MNLTLDRRIYPDSVISKAIYWLSGRYDVMRTMADPHTEVIAIPDEAEGELMRLLHDFKLRQIVADETRDIKTILYAKAFAEDEDLSSNDIHD